MPNVGRMKIGNIEIALTLLIILVIGSWLYLPFLVENITGLKTIEERGQLGDMYNIVNSLFSGLTILGLIITLIGQRADSKSAFLNFVEQKEQAQRHHNEQKAQARQIFNEQKKQIQDNFNEEINQAKVAYDAQQKEIQESKRLARIDLFNDVFFNALTLNETIASNLNTIYGKPLERKSYFEVIFAELDTHYKQSGDSKEVRLKSFFAAHEWRIGHYFRNTVSAINILEKQGESQIYYIDILKSRMSNDELRLLFYYLVYLGIICADHTNSMTQEREFEILKTAAKEYQLFDVIKHRSGINLILEDDWVSFDHFTRRFPGEL
jgi:hypothetical protein